MMTMMIVEYWWDNKYLIFFHKFRSENLLHITYSFFSVFMENFQFILWFERIR
jgi:hypothetical protein